MAARADLYALDRGSGRPVVLLHGWSFSHVALAPQIEAWSHRARVVAVDLRGHGRSPAAEGPAPVEELAADVAGVFDRLGLDGALLAGWSWGAQVALAAVPTLRPRLAGLALLSPTPRFTAGDGWPHGLPASSVRALSRRLLRDPEGTRRLFFDQMFAEGEIAPAERERIARSILHPAPSLHSARAGLEALVEADLRATAAAARELKVVIAHGELDAVCLPGAAAWLAEAIPGASLVTIAGAGHAPHLTRPDAVNGAIGGLLEALG